MLCQKYGPTKSCGFCAQVITLRDESGEEHLQRLYDIQPDGTGRLDWTAVRHAFQADLVEITGEGTPSLLRRGAFEGFTLATYTPGSVISIQFQRREGRKHAVPKTGSARLKHYNDS